ncbi:hypothetical protein B566_EDAN013880 [Ephemera danica]|nr:hypothetical protein B566_EDAN013880 [Ephemera danica]
MDHKDLVCLVCRSVVDEIELEIQKESPKKMIEIGGYRLDSHGNQKQKVVPYMRSEMHIHDVLEKVCDRMTDYVQATYKESGEPLLLRIVTPDGKMNPDMARVDITPDDNLNKGLEYYCRNIIDEQEDDIVRLFTNNSDHIDIRLCTDVMQMCSQTIPNDYDGSDREEL